MLSGVLLCGCFAFERSATVFRIANETDALLVVTAIDRVLRISPGEDGIIVGDGCYSDRLEAASLDGTIVAVLDEEYRHDEVWTITGVDEATLTDDS